MSALSVLGKPPPLWSTAVLAMLFVPAVWAHEPVFGAGVGLTAAGAGVAAGLLVAVLARVFRMDGWTVTAVAVAGYLLGSGPAALRETTLWGFVPTWQTLQYAVVQAVMSWKDLLTLAPPAMAYTGPAVLPWLCGLVCALLAGLITLRLGRPVLGTAPIAVFGLIGIAWGRSGYDPPRWPVLVWLLAVFVWWAWCSNWQRIGAGQDVLVGRGAATRAETGAQTPNHRSVVHLGRQLLGGVLALAVVSAATLPIIYGVVAFPGRTVLRDLIEPPLDLHEFPSPLSSFRHYTTDLKDQVIVAVSSLPEGARVRLAVMDSYNGVVFGMSNATASTTEGSYARAGRKLLAEPWAGEGAAMTATIRTSGLTGPWVPTLGIPDTLEFKGDNAVSLQDNLYANRWAAAALTTGDLSGRAEYELHAVVPPPRTDGQLRGLDTAVLGRSEITVVPEGVSDLARSVTARSQTQLDRVRAVEKYLSGRGFFSNTDQSMPSHRADRLARMIDGEQMIGDDEQYAALMALMLRSMNIPARVVMGLHQEGQDGSAADLHGYDMHAWVEVEFEQVGWVAFDPTPPRDQVPETSTSKPRSEPRPQVLQPPEPPQDPVDLPLSVTERSVDNLEAEAAQIQWRIVFLVGGLLLALLSPLLMICWIKWLRTHKRRKATDPALAASGSWDEVVDFAVDAGVRVPLNLTRQESAWLLQAGWDESAGKARKWIVSGEELPTVVALARIADIAAYSDQQITPELAKSAWRYADDLRKEHRAGNLLARTRRALSLRSLRRAGRQRRAMVRGRP
ncbi:MAG: DUF3488 and transglutaminase-like domain-containing protein [Propionibacteriaceae bacterium]|jgi:hypothetical protein|nr:DUF3488 and transglutaminase-like domain-containing protein [Propionibacteriaceae bacterium]